MAITEKVKGVSLSLVSNGGTDAACDAIVATKTFSGVNQAASASQVYTGAKAIHTLYNGSLEHVYTKTTKELAEEA